MRTCRTCGKSIEHRRADAKFCDDKCKARRGVPHPDTEPPAPSPPPSGSEHPATAPQVPEPACSDLAAALAGVPTTAPATDGGGTLPVSPSAVVPVPPVRDEGRERDRALGALHDRLDRGLAGLADRPTKAEVAAMIKAALAPVQKDLARVDRDYASTGATDRLHEEVERLEVQLLGYPAERWDEHNRELPPVAAHAIPDRVVELEKAVWGWAATEPEDSPQVEEGDPEHVTGKLTVLNERVGVLGDEHEELERALTALMLVLNTVFSKRWGVELAPMVREQVARLKNEGRGVG